MDIVGVSVSTGASFTLFTSISNRKFTPSIRNHANLSLWLSSRLFFLPTAKSASLCQMPPLSISTTAIDDEDVKKNPIIEKSRDSYVRRRKSKPSSDQDEIFSNLLRLAVRNQDVGFGSQIHAAILKIHDDDGGESSMVLFNKVIAMYIKLRRVSYARKVFDQMKFPDVVTYTSLISAYAKCGKEREVVDLFLTMRLADIDFNEFTIVAVLTSCIRNFNLKLGMQVHVLAIKIYNTLDIYISNALMGLYGRLQRSHDVVRLFDKMPNRDVSSWNAVIFGTLKEFRYEQAFTFFHDMRMAGFSGDKFTLSTLLMASEEGLYMEEGEMIHCHSIKIGLELDLSVGNALMSHYTKFSHHVNDIVNIFERMPSKDVISCTSMVWGFMEFGKVKSALEVFNQMKEINSVSYNALMAGFCQNGEYLQALELFRKVIEEGMELSDFTLGTAIHACALASDVERSKQIHGFVTKVGFGSNARIKSSLVDMYSKCNRMKEARMIFDTGGVFNGESCLIGSTSLICGYARNGYFEEALYFFTKLLKHERFGVSIDEILVSTVLGVCGDLGFVDIGKQLHVYVLKLKNHPFDVTLWNSLFSMYSKSGSSDDAAKVYDSMPKHDVTTWNTLIAGHVLHRQGDEAVITWKKMIETSNVTPDHISFLLVLLASKYTSYDPVDICHGLFTSMSSYGIKPHEEHYAAIVSVFGHWNNFNEAEDLIKNMPSEAGALVWRSLLDTCRLNSNFMLGKQAMNHILESTPTDPSTYILISNLYSALGRWHRSEKTRQEMRDKGLRKVPSQSWIFHQNKIHSFHARDQTHLESKDIYSALNILILECMKVGYAPDRSYVLHEVEEFQKENFLFYHSAKLAVTYGHLITTMKGSRAVRVMKNVRLCGDCHSFMKFFSVVTARKIFFRDTSGFHWFIDGRCSCEVQ